MDIQKLKARVDLGRYEHNFDFRFDFVSAVP